MSFRKKIALALSAFTLIFFFNIRMAQALPVGTLLYRSSSNSNLYGYNTDELIRVKNGLIKNIYTGHVAIYVGQENGIDYIVEAMPNGIIKIPAKYFLNSKNGEKLIGAKIPRNLTEAQRIRVAELAKKMAESNLSYDFDFKKQKGPRSGEWICVGLTEKLYESANISNPLDLSQLEYNPENYAINITPDGFDNYSIINQRNGDCLSKELEFSKIENERRTVLPLPELFGFSAGLEHAGSRYFFFPLTQYWQASLVDVPVDIVLESDFSDRELRGKVPELSMVFRWSFINNPASSIKLAFNKISNFFFKPQSEALAFNQTNNNNSSNSSNYYNDNSSNNSDNNSNHYNNTTNSNDSSTVNNNYNNSSGSGSNNNSSNSGNSGSGNNSSDNSSGSGITIENDEDFVPPNLDDDFNDEENDEVDDNYHNSEDEDGELTNEDSNNNLVDNSFRNLLISKIYATADDDYIEIYNPSNKAINLADSNFRLYKARTALSPTLMLIFGKAEHGTYPGGLVINPRSTYLVASDKAKAEIRSRAQAIINNKNFYFPGKDYTIYLGAGVVSSDSDEDIIDKVGYGGAKYYFSRPAPEILDDHILLRKVRADSNSQSMSLGGLDYGQGPAYNTRNNFNDFILFSLKPKNEPENNNNNLNEVENNNEEDESNNNQESNEEDNNSNNNDSSNENSNSNNQNENNSTNSQSNNNSSGQANDESPQLLISRIYSTASDDYIELYNPNNFSVNLIEHNYRLYKVKNSGFYLMLALADFEDSLSTYPGGLVIPARGHYKIIRSQAREGLRISAQVITERANFSLTGDAYTVYLGTDVVSNDDDPDIIDKVGYGEAKYYSVYPAPAIPDEQVLVRKARSDSTAADMAKGGAHAHLGNAYNSGNNSQDFVLLDLNYNYASSSSSNSEEGDEGNEIGGSGTGNNDEEDDPNQNNTNPNPNQDASSGNYCIHPGLYFDSLIHLWHLDEGEGTRLYDAAQDRVNRLNSIWQEGKFGAGLKQYFDQDFLNTPLDESFDSNNFSVSFYYKNLQVNSRPMIKFSNSINGNYFHIKLYHYYTDLYRVPAKDGNDQGLFRIDELTWPSDDDWHLFFWVVNKDQGYWALYRDGSELYRADISNKTFFKVDTFSVKGDNGYNLMDEIAIFNRPLSSSEIRQINNLGLPLNPSTCYNNFSEELDLLHYWDFNDFSDEGNNLDLIAGSSFFVLPQEQYFNQNNTYIKVSDSNYATIPAYQTRQKPLSLSFWWKAEDYQQSFSSLISLNCAGERIFGLNINKSRLYYYFNNINTQINSANFSGFTSHSWQHFMLSYDPYWMKLRLYHNGELLESWNKEWLNDCPLEKVELYSAGSLAPNSGFFLDNLAVWSSYLSPSQAEELYNEEKSIFID